MILKKIIFLVQLPATFHVSATKKKDLKRSYCCTLESGLDFLWEEINGNGGVIVDARNDYGGKEAPAWVEYEFSQHLNKETPNYQYEFSL